MELKDIKQKIWLFGHPNEERVALFKCYLILEAFERDVDLKVIPLQNVSH